MDALLAIPKAQLIVQEAYRHHKPIAAWGAGVEALSNYGIPAGADGVVAATRMSATFAKNVTTAIAWHRHWNRVAIG